MPKEDKTNKIITAALALAIIVSVFTILYVNLPKNREDIKTSDDFDENQEWQNGDSEPEKVTVLTVIYGDLQTNYTLDELKAVESYTGVGEYKTQYPSIKGRGNYTGVPVTTLAELIAGDIRNYSAIVYSYDGEKKDNKSYNFSMVQGNVDIYNTTNASDPTPIATGGVTMIVSYKKDGAYLDESKDGKLKIAFIGKEELITSAGLWWKFVVSIEIIPERGFG